MTRASQWLRSLVFRFLTRFVSRPGLSFHLTDSLYLVYRMTRDEVTELRACLPAGFSPEQLRFAECEAEADYLICCHVYNVRIGANSPRARCEVSSFVRLPDGRLGFYMFRGSPFVSGACVPSLLGRFEVLMERLVIGLYGAGEVGEVQVALDGAEPGVRVAMGPHRFELSFRSAPDSEYALSRLTGLLVEHTSLAVYEHGRIVDQVYFDHTLPNARLRVVPPESLSRFESSLPRIATRRPDAIYFVREPIPFHVFPHQRVVTP